MGFEPKSHLGLGFFSESSFLHTFNIIVVIVVFSLTNKLNCDKHIFSSELKYEAVTSLLACTKFFKKIKISFLTFSRPSSCSHGKLDLCDQRTVI